MLFIIPTGTTDLSLPVSMFDSATGQRAGGITPATAGLGVKVARLGHPLVTSPQLVLLAGPDSPHTDWGWVEITSGRYRLDLPDSVAAAGARYVVVTVVTNDHEAEEIVLDLSLLRALSTEVWGRVLESEGSYTAQQVMSSLMAFSSGVSRQGGTEFATPNGAATRLAAVVNANRERVSVTITPSAFPE